MKCIFCKINIKEIEKSRKPDGGMYFDAVVDSISANYGSKFDGDIFLIAMCDECIENENVKKIGNYLDN